jgi:hypothetical protein
MLLLTVSSGTGRPYTLNHLGHHIIVSERISIGKILARALLCLLLCGMFAGQLPELLSLTDNAKNDFSVTGARPVVPPVRLNARKHVRIADKDSAPAPNLLFSRQSPFKKAELVPSDISFFTPFSVRSPKTVEFHKHHIMKAFNLENNAALVLFALKQGLISLKSVVA